jgi:hypothetical protein
VAEGIQSQEDVDRLGTLGCDFGQGYFIGEPMTAKQVVDVLSGVPIGAAKNKTAIDTLWERMSGTSNVRVPEPPPAVEETPAPVKRPVPEPVTAKGTPPTALPPLPDAKQPAKAEQSETPSKRPIVLLPPLTPPVFDRSGASTPKAPPPPPPLPAPEEPEAASDLVKSEASNLPAPPLPGIAPMAPRAAARSAQSTEDELAAQEPASVETEGEAEEQALDEAAGDETQPADGDEPTPELDEAQGEPEIAEPSTKDDEISQEAKARLGRKLRRKAASKEQPPVDA